MDTMADYFLGGRHYRSQAAIIERAKLLLHTAPLNMALAGEAHGFLEDLLHRHERAPEKIGAGIKHFEVRNAAINSKCFWVVRVDGTATDFSYKLCIRPSTPLGNFTAAARRAVAIQLIAFRDDWFDRYADADGTVTCEITGARYSKTEVDVDHIAPDTFASILHNFIRDACIDVDRVEYVQGDGVMLQQFKDPRLLQGWTRYHQRHASLRVISQVANRVILPRRLAKGA
jgi:hypothetical protein